MQPMLRTADDQDEGHMIVGSRFAAPDDYLALGLRPEAALLCRGCALSRRTIRDPRYDGVLRTGQCRTNGRWPFRWSSLAELFDFTRDDWPPLDPRAELFDAGSGSIRWESATADLRMDERQAARRLTRDRRALVWSLARFPTRRRHLARSAGTQLITRAVHPPAALSDEGADTADTAEERVATERRRIRRHAPSLLITELSSIDACDRRRLGRFGRHIGRSTRPIRTSPTSKAICPSGWRCTARN